jgi:hypothetical protein
MSQFPLEQMNSKRAVSSVSYTVRGNETGVDEYQLEQIILRIKLMVF